jgi:hypothetical protein
MAVNTSYLKGVYNDSGEITISRAVVNTSYLKGIYNVG